MRLIARDLEYAWANSATGLATFTGEFEPGIPHCICGPTGSGKTTLSLLLAGLLEPVTGYVTGAETAARRGYIFQMPEGIFFEDSVAREMEIAAGPRGLRRARKLFAELGIDFADVAAQHPLQLSGGYGRLAALVLQMVREPDVLIADEPTIGLDWQFQSRVTALLQSWLSPERILIVVTHDVDFLRALNGSCWIMQDGRLTWQGAAEVLLAQQELLAQFGLA